MGALRRGVGISETARQINSPNQVRNASGDLPIPLLARLQRLRRSLTLGDVLKRKLQQTVLAGLKAHQVHLRVPDPPVRTLVAPLENDAALGLRLRDIESGLLG